MAIVRILGINLAVLAASLAAADGLLWLLAPIELEDQAIETEILQNHPGVKPRIVYTRSRYGYRSTSMNSPDVRRADLRVLCLGASTTNQETQETQDIWCSLLGDYLQTDSGLTVETAAMGRSGWKAIDLLHWINQNISDYRPDTAVVLMGVNDMALAGGPDYSYFGVDAALAQRAFSRNQVKSISQIVRRTVLVKRGLFPARSKGGVQFAWSSEHMLALRTKLQGLPYSDSPERSPDPIEEFGDAMTRVVSSLTGAGAKVIVAGQPVLWKELMTEEEQQARWFVVRSANGDVRASGRWLYNEMRRFNDVQKDIAESAGQTFVDLQTLIPASLEVFYDDCHFTDAGNILVAKQVLPSVLTGGVTQPHEPRM